jgi:tetratricopeptide (TPR) repeat protein
MFNFNKKLIGVIVARPQPGFIANEVLAKVTSIKERYFFAESVYGRIFIRFKNCEQFSKPLQRNDVIQSTLVNADPSQNFNGINVKFLHRPHLYSYEQKGKLIEATRIAKKMDSESKIDYLIQVHQDFPDDIRILTMLINAYFENFNDYQQPIDFFLKKALKINPLEPYVLSLASKYNLKIGNHDLAEKQIRYLISVFPDDVIALTNLAQLEFSKGHYQKAIEKFEVALKVNPFDEVILNSLGKSEWLNGSRARAIMRFKQTLEINPYNPIALASLNELEQLR